MLARFLDTDSISKNQVIQTSLSHAFCQLIGSVEDINAAVAQKAIMFLETIRPVALRVCITILRLSIMTCSLRIVIVSHLILFPLSYFVSNHYLHFTNVRCLERLSCSRIL